MDKAILDPNKLYNIEYPWGKETRKGVGRVGHQNGSPDNVYIICQGGGVTISSRKDVNFLSEVGSVTE